MLSIEVAQRQTASIAAQFSFRDKSMDFEQLDVRVGDKRMPLTLMEPALLRTIPRARVTFKRSGASDTVSWPTRTNECQM